jgi:hypothetical protein
MVHANNRGVSMACVAASASAIKQVIEKPPEFPVNGAHSLLTGLSLLPLHKAANKGALHALIQRVYPYHLIGKTAEKREQHSKIVEQALKQFQLIDSNRVQSSSNGAPLLRVSHIRCTANGNRATASIELGDNAQHVLDVAVGENAPRLPTNSSVDSGTSATQRPNRVFVSSSIKETLANMLHDHAIGKDICIVGERGSGKSVLVQLFADALGYDVQQMLLYRDMSSRDLTLHRTTRCTPTVASAAQSLSAQELHDTQWQYSPLINAAIHGKLAVLDNIDRLPPTLLSSIAALIQTREVCVGAS